MTNKKIPSHILKQVRDTIDSYHLLDSNSKILIGFSTGPDSVGLLIALDKLGFRGDLCYIDHGQRPVSDEIDLTEEYAKRHDLKCYIEKIEDRARDEAGMRKERYRILNRIADYGNYNRIAVGHTLTDQLETIIINLIRGSTNVRPIPPKRGKIIRPLIETTKGEIIEFIDSEGSKYSTDPTNESLNYTRNKIRQKVVPILTSINPGIYHQLKKNIRFWLEDDEYFNSLIPKITTKDLDINILKTYNPVMRRKAIINWVINSADIQPDSRIITEISNLTGSESGKKAQVADGLTVVREFDKLHIAKDEDEQYRYQLQIPGELRIKDGRIVAQVVEERPVTFSDGEIFLDLEELDPPLFARSWHEGDQMIPFGMEGKKKVKEIWNEKKIPIHQRFTIPIITDSKTILWIAGIKRSNKAPITKKTKKILKISYEIE